MGLTRMPQIRHWQLQRHNRSYKSCSCSYASNWKAGSSVSHSHNDLAMTTSSVIRELEAAASLLYCTVHHTPGASVSSVDRRSTQHEPATPIFLFLLRKRSKLKTTTAIDVRCVVTRHGLAKSDSSVQVVTEGTHQVSATLTTGRT